MTGSPAPQGKDEKTTGMLGQEACAGFVQRFRKNARWIKRMFSQPHQHQTTVAALLCAALAFIILWRRPGQLFANPARKRRVPDGQCFPRSVDFGEVTVGSQGTSLVTITNSGVQPMIDSADGP